MSKAELDKMFNVDEIKIAKMAEIDAATGGSLPLPEKGEGVTIRFIGTPKHIVNDKLPNKSAVSARIVIYGRESDLTYDLWVSSTIYKGILAELKKAKVPVDNELTCLIGRIFTIVGRTYTNAPKDQWKVNDVTKKLECPKTYGVALRTDLESRGTGGNTSDAGGPGGPDLMSFM